VVWVLWACLAGSACGGDDGVQPVPQALVGTWVVQSLVVDGADLAQLGFGFSFRLDSDGRYTLAVENSQLIICELGSFCEDGGSFSVTDTQIVFDPDTSPKPFVYSVAGDVLTLTGIASNGSEVVFTLVRAPGSF
jgi:hypothetical protein